MVVVVLCSTGLPKEERAQLARSACDLKSAGVVYNGDLTSVTTHLIALSRSNGSAKMACAAARALPVVLPTWLHDSARAGVLLPLKGKYVLPAVGGDESRASVASSTDADDRTTRHPLAERQEDNGVRGDPSRHASCSAAPAPGRIANVLSLLHRAHLEAELTDEVVREAVAAGAGAHITLGGRKCLLDALTDFCRAAGTSADEGRSGFGEAPRAGNPYSLRSLLLGLACRRLAHGDYFLTCLRWDPYTPPVLVHDKQALLQAVRLAAAGGDAGHGGDEEMRSVAASESLSQGAGCGAPSSEPTRVTGEMSCVEAQLRSQLASLQRLLQEQQRLAYEGGRMPSAELH